MKRLAIFIGILALLSASCSSTDDTSDTTTTTTVTTTTTEPSEITTTSITLPTIITTTTVAAGVMPADYIAFREQTTACGAERPAPLQVMVFEEPVDMGLNGTVNGVFETSCGDIEFVLNTTSAPESVNSFIFLAEEKYFNNSASHRILPGFVLQAGDQSATGLGGPGYVLPDEFPENDNGYPRGTIAMANSGPGTTGSQFFIMFESAPLPPQYSIIGIVTDGFDVLDRISSEIPLGVNQYGEPSVPLETLYIERVTINR